MTADFLLEIKQLDNSSNTFKIKTKPNPENIFQNEDKDFLDK